MIKFVRHLSIVAIIAALGAGLAAQASFSAADSKELASYRLTMDTVQKVNTMMRSLADEMRKDPKVQALMKTEAEIETLEKKDDLSDAESERLSKLRELKEQQEEAAQASRPDGANLNNAQTLDDMEAGLRKFPQAMAALNRAGLTPREYSKFMIATLQAGMVAGLQKAGMLKQLPPELKEINPENIKFMIEHEAEFEAMRKELEGQGVR